MASSALVELQSPYSRVHIYSTKARLYAVAYEDGDACRILAFKRQDGFTESYYLLVITRREYVGHVCGHKVYRVADTALLPLGLSMQRLDNGAAESVAERRYRKLLLGVDLTRNFFFSYTYRLTHTLQHNHTAAAPAAPRPGACPTRDTAAGGGGESGSSSGTGSSTGSGGAAGGNGMAGEDPPGLAVFEGSMFAWNAHLTRPLRTAAGSARWTVPLVHGFWEQRQMSLFGRHITLTLVARRSRHFAGTRYRKRGINDQGFVANEVETEQIVDAGVDWATGQLLWSSVVQLRGSVPLFWSQQATPLSPKPDIVLQQFDPLYTATARHFADLGARYGHPCVVLNLLRAKERRPRETLLRREYGAALQLINDALPHGSKIGYVSWDFARHAKQPGSNILVELSPLVATALDMTGVYVHGPDTCPVCAPAFERRMAALAAAMAAAPGGRLLRQRRRRSVEAAGPLYLQQGYFLRRAGGGGPDCCSGGESIGVTCAAEAAADEDSGAGRRTRGAAAGAPPGGAGQPPPPPPPPPPRLRPKGRATAPVTRLQRGVLRTNCVDCLDRTNVAQFAFGLAWEVNAALAAVRSPSTAVPF
ncbi:hypothetical protein MNEG_7144 [Monoraphidium neglectum]|uniref:SAC domain-containing protein n=1 Tax=Monoraphidium neglectum TaxID=145388 RepID=A0A0D2N425_9CHLO|nr:hypothetical protein MNEG_7144 [Monoraphidium neglectum]KIZ00821.1 hypothetical protein MNEG_7144 [Monoraphidium neglectum]|eukprot:XP_013899840.1 hypothetical protein MNEG_7144 [Monoraphidium neglectum]